MSPKKIKPEYVTTRVPSPDKFNCGASKTIEGKIIWVTKYLSDGRRIQIKSKGTRILGILLGICVMSAVIIGIGYGIELIISIFR